LESSNDGKKVTVEMEYKLLFKGNHWLVYDVITDEQSMLENYRAEFNKIITKESFDALLKRMKKRLEKAE
jgi:phospholipid transport system substrate-binding protein